MSDFLGILLEIVINPIFVAAIGAVAISQILKIFYYRLKENKFNLKYLASSGGFPSSHASTVTALSLSVGFQEGFSSTIFILAVTFSLIVMYDAAGVRQAAGEQAKVLNKIMDDSVTDKNYNNDESLKELIGHNPVEVAAGALIGLLTALFVNLCL